MKQNHTSKDTSINKNKLPAVYHKLDWNALRDEFHNTTIIDYGCGKFNNAKEYADRLNMAWFGYDPYNRTEEENEVAYAAPANVIVCSNVLNVIDSVEAIQSLVDEVMMMAEMNGADYFFTVYEGDKSGKGKETKKDCYQRNEKAQSYMKFFEDYGAFYRHGVITNRPGAVL